MTANNSRGREGGFDAPVCVCDSLLVVHRAGNVHVGEKHAPGFQRALRTKKGGGGFKHTIYHDWSFHDWQIVRSRIQSRSKRMATVKNIMKAIFPLFAICVRENTGGEI